MIIIWNAQQFSWVKQININLHTASLKKCTEIELPREAFAKKRMKKPTNGKVCVFTFECRSISRSFIFWTNKKKKPVKCYTENNLLANGAYALSFLLNLLSSRERMIFYKFYFNLDFIWFLELAHRNVSRTHFLFHNMEERRSARQVFHYDNSLVCVLKIDISARMGL